MTLFPAWHTRTTRAATTGLVAAYSFDEASGSTVQDTSGNGNNGTIANATRTAAGKFNGALSFNGTNARVNIPNSSSLQLSSGMTLEAWVNPSTVTNAWRDVIYKGNDNYYLMATTNRSSAPAGGGTFGGKSTNAYGTTKLATNTWAHLATTYDGANLRLYVNGSLVSTVAKTGSITSSTNQLQLGGDQFFGQWFSGLIDEVRIYNVALSAAAIQTDMTTPVGVPDSTPPTAPGALSSTAVGPSEIDLSWGAATDNVGVTGYQILRCQGAGCTNFAPLTTQSGTGTTYKDQNLSANTSYSYQVRATDAAGNLGPVSNTSTATTQVSTDTTPPTMPTGLAASGIGPTSATLSWTASNDNVGVTGYRLYLGTTQVGTSLTTSFLYTNLNCNTSYTAGVAAVDAAGNLSAQATLGFQTAACPDTTPPSAPGTLTTSVGGPNELDLGWGPATDNVGVTGYQVLRCQGAGCSNFTLVTTQGGSSTTYKDLGLTAGTTYSYQVRALDAAGNQGPVSNTSSATTPQASATVVAAYSFDAGSGTTVADSSGNGNTGTIANATWSTSGKFNGALSFNGTNARVNVPNSASLQLTSGMTLEAWVNPSSVTTGWRDVIYKGNDNYYLMATTDHSGAPGGGGTFGGANANAFGSAALLVNQWSYLAVTYDGATLRLYLNGNLIGSQAKAGAITVTTNQLQLGGDQFWGQYFSGLIDEVRIYNQSISAAQIQADMATPIGNGVPDNTPPSTPTGLATSGIGQTSATLTWTASGDNVGVTGYRLYVNGAQVGTSLSTSYLYSGLSCGTSYTLGVAAVDAASNVSPLATIGLVTSACPDTTPPSAPGTLSSSPISSGEIDLSWTPATDDVGVTGYQILRCQGTGCTNLAVVAQTGANTAYQDLSLSANTSYSYQVRAMDAAGNLGPTSNTTTAITQASTDTTPPTAPGTLTAAAVAPTEVDLSWGAATDNVAVTGYRIDRCNGIGCSNFSHLIQLSGTGTTYRDTSVSANSPYTYQVRALDSAGNLGPVSNSSSATTPAGAAPGLVASYTFDEGSGTTVHDTSGAGNNGTVANATWTANGQFGGALSFNGSSTARVTVPNAPSLQLTTGMTLEAWVNPTTTTTGWRDVIYKGNDNYYLMATSDHAGSPDGGGTFAGVNANAFGTGTLPVNTWSYIATTYDGVTLRFYLNGVLVSSVAQAGTIATSTNPLTIGSDSFYGQGFSGLIDEVRVYNAALTGSQIQADMNEAGTGVPSAPTNVTFTVPSTTEVDLSWSPSVDTAGVTGYRVERCQGSGCTSFTQIAAPTGTSLNDTGLTPSTTYVYRIRAIDSAGKLGPYSDTVTAFTGVTMTPQQTTLTPGQAQQFSAQLPGGGTASVNWSVDGVVGGSSSAGTISTDGLYTAPATAGVHTVTAATTDGSLSVNGTANVSNYPGTFTYHNDNLRTGANLNETVLTPANVKTSTFGRLFQVPIDGVTHASPLYVENVAVPNQGTHNIVYVATEHDSIYAYDADRRSTTPIWHDSFIDPANGITTVSSADVGECCDITPEIGITGTPVIDRSTNTMYVVVKTKEVSGGTTKFVQRLHALDIATGAEKLGGPVVIQASVPGNGNGSVGGRVPFDPLRENQRTALLLLNGTLYFGFASHGDNQPYHGWVLGYNATTLQQTLAWNSTPDQEGGGVWMSGGGIATDASGALFFVTGDGEFDGTTQFGDSYVKLTTAGVVSDFFTPYNQASLNTDNHDLGAGGLLLLPDQPGAHPHEMVDAGKDGSMYLVDRDNLGRYNSTTDNNVQTLTNIFTSGTPEPGNFSAPVYWNGFVFFGPLGENVQAYKLTNGLLPTTPTLRSAVTFTDDRGASLSASSNGSTNGILWAVQRSSSGASGTLYAYDPMGSTGGVLKELWDSDQAGARDTMDVASKFTLPTVANGKVYVAGVNELTVYGLLP